MTIGIDCGALCGSEFGNYIFTKNLIQAINKYDKKNYYLLYSFCRLPSDIKFKKNIRFLLTLPKRFWMTYAVSKSEYKNKSDVFLGLNQAFPLSFSRKIIFSHGLSFVFYKKLYPDSFKKMTSQIKKMINKADKIVLSSKRVKKEFQTVFGVSNKYVVINFGIPFDFQKQQKRIKKKYFLNVAVNHPIKKIKFIVNCFELFNKNNKNIYKLYLVTNKKYEFIRNKNIVQIYKITRNNLLNLYAQAQAYLTASLYESFNFPVLEALSQNTQVIALKHAVIPEMEKYVDLSDNKNDFIKKMQKVIIHKKNIDISKLNNEFSWEHYIKKLKTLYKYD